MDSILEKMRQNGVPINLKNYLHVAYLGTPPSELGAEELAEIPEEILDHEVKEGGDGNHD